MSGKILADGTVGASVAAIYTVPADKYATLAGVLISNTSGTTETVVVALKRSGQTARRYARAVLAPNEQFRVLDAGEEIALVSGDAIQAGTTNAAACEFIVIGTEGL